MAVITFLSDFGMKDHYVAAVKAEILTLNQSQVVVDISHDIKRHDLLHGAHVLKRVFRSFPEGSVHMVAIDSVNIESRELVALRLENHFFIGHNSGFYGLVSSEIPTAIVKLGNANSTFPAKDVFAKAALQLALGKEISSLGTPIENLVQKVDRQLKLTKREIVGQVVYIDHFGNLITNIEKGHFDKIAELNGGTPNYQVRFSREVFTTFHTGYSDVDNGDCFVFFNSYGVLEIGINKGRASDLLGLKHDDLITIEFG